MGLLWAPLARFTQFVRPPGTVINYLRAIKVGSESRYIGHNPAGGAMIVVLLAGMAATAVSGWLLTTDAFWGSTLQCKLAHSPCSPIRHVVPPAPSSSLISSAGGFFFFFFFFFPRKLLPPGSREIFCSQRDDPPGAIKRIPVGRAWADGGPLDPLVPTPSSLVSPRSQWSRAVRDDCPRRGSRGRAGRQLRRPARDRGRFPARAPGRPRDGSVGRSRSFPRRLRRGSCRRHTNSIPVGVRSPLTSILTPGGV